MTAFVLGILYEFQQKTENFNDHLLFASGVVWITRRGVVPCFDSFSLLGFFSLTLVEETLPEPPPPVGVDEMEFATNSPTRTFAFCPKNQYVRCKIAFTNERSVLTSPSVVGLIG